MKKTGGQDATGSSLFNPLLTHSLPQSVKPLFKKLLNPAHVLIISPALAKANNGNWQTARRWAGFLKGKYRVDCRMEWDARYHCAPDVLIALHARRSAATIMAFAAQYPHRPLVLVLTGTDLYRDIHSDAAAQQSLRLASVLVVLQQAGLDQLAVPFQQKAIVIHQSAPTLTPYPRTGTARHFTVIMIGHLRDEKLPQTFMQAAALIRTPAVRLLHVGEALDPGLGILARQTADTLPRYQWTGALPHSQARQRLKRSALMVIASRMEGGANVIIEAITSGVPVLASDIAGNRGMLGNDYAGYFPVGDSVALACMIDRAATDTMFYAELKQQCALRAALFAPALENAAVLQMTDNCLLNINSTQQLGMT